MELTASPGQLSKVRFKVLKVPNWRAKAYKFISLNLWGSLPSSFQKSISSWYTSVYNHPFSKNIIKPYLRVNYKNSNYLEDFKPPYGKSDFESFQDFFIREFKTLPENREEFVWPCEGLLCESEKIADLNITKVKGDHRHVEVVFGVEGSIIPSEYSYTNVFLHNKNYHRIHAPIEGEISRIQHIPGDLVVLRPWIYQQNPSIPAMRNERYNIDITDKNGEIWYLSIVGGPAVGTIELPQNVFQGARIEKLQELALFYLGSTCCMASPRPPRFHKKNSFVAVGETY